MADASLWEGMETKGSRGRAYLELRGANHSAPPTNDELVFAGAEA